MIVRTILRTFAALAIVAGLVIGHAAAANCDRMQVAAPDQAAMTDGMDCCPKVPGQKTYPKCPLVALCMAAFVAGQDAPATIGEKSGVLARGLVPSSEPLPRSLSSVPPSRPPRGVI